MNCPRCRAIITVNDVDRNFPVVVCRKCNGMFLWTNQPPAPGAFDELAATSANRPKGVRIEVTESIRRMEGYWSHSSQTFFWYICLCWVGAALFCFCAALATSSVPWFVYGMLGVFLAIGLLLTYRTLVLSRNRIIVEVTADQLSVRSVPLPWIGTQVVLRRRDLRLLYGREVPYSRNEEYGEPSRENAVGFTHSVAAVLADDSEIVLLNDLNKQEALFAMQQLTEWLQIQSEPKEFNRPKRASREGQR